MWGALWSGPRSGGCWPHVRRIRGKDLRGNTGRGGGSTPRASGCRWLGSVGWSHRRGGTRATTKRLIAHQERSGRDRHSCQEKSQDDPGPPPWIWRMGLGAGGNTFEGIACDTSTCRRWRIRRDGRIDACLLRWCGDDRCDGSGAAAARGGLVRESTGEFCRVSIPTLGILFKRAQCHRARSGRERGIVVPRRGRIAVQVLHGDPNRGIRFKREVTGKHFVEHNAERIDIGRRRRRASPGLARERSSVPFR